jgi:hypothetical protein
VSTGGNAVSVPTSSSLDRAARRERLARAPFRPAVLTAVGVLVIGVVVEAATGFAAVLVGAVAATVGVLGLRLLARHQLRRNDNGGT